MFNYMFIKKPNKERLPNLRVNDNCDSLFVGHITHKSWCFIKYGYKLPYFFAATLTLFLQIVSVRQ